MKAQWRGWATRLNLDRIIRYWLGGRGLILMLHRVAATPGAWRGDPGLWISAETLSALIHTLRTLDYQWVTLDQALNWPRRAPRFACLTFDDGYRDNYQIALPLLQALEVPATVYITSGFIDGTALAWWYGLEAILNQHPLLILRLQDQEQRWLAADPAQKRIAYQQACQRLRTAAPAVRAQALGDLQQEYRLDFRAISLEQMLTQTMLRELAASDLVELGAHTVSHPALSALPLAEARTEISASQQTLETQYGQPVRHFAYPYGDRAAVNPAVQALAQECGFASATLAYGGPVQSSADRYALPRIPFGGADSMENLRWRASGAPARLARFRPLPA